MRRSATAILTIGFGIAGALFAGVGAALYARAWHETRDAEMAGQRAEAACRGTLSTLGAVTRTAEGHLRLVVGDVPDPRSRLADASAAFAACPGFEIAYFCLGERCGAERRVSMVLDLAARAD